MRNVLHGPTRQYLGIDQAGTLDVPLQIGICLKPLILVEPCLNQVFFLQGTKALANRGNVARSWHKRTLNVYPATSITTTVITEVLERYPLEPNASGRLFRLLSSVLVIFCSICFQLGVFNTVRHSIQPQKIAFPDGELSLQVAACPRWAGCFRLGHGYSCR